MFANAVHRIIDQHLPDFKEETKVVLRLELLSRLGIAWLNTKYAEDPNWWVGVTAIFEQMKREIEEVM